MKVEIRDKIELGIPEWSKASGWWVGYGEMKIQGGEEHLRGTVLYNSLMGESLEKVFFWGGYVELGEL